MWQVGTGVHITASELPVAVDAAVNSPLYSGLIVAALAALGGWFSRTAFRQGRRFGWSVLYDERINQDDPTPPPPQGSVQASHQNMWEILYQEGGPEPYEVKNGSLVVMEMRNIGRLPIRESDFDERRDFTLRFPGRKVVHYKVRDNPRYRDKVHGDDREPPRPGAGSSFDLPALQMNRNDGFKLLVLLESETDHPPAAYDKPVVEGSIQGGGFVEYGRSRRRRRYGAMALAGLILIAGGIYGGDKIANRALTPDPACGSGDITVAGSTAFAPVLNQVATEYEQHCPGARISITADGSVKGLQELEGGRAAIAMYDGTPTEAVDPQYRAEAVGDVIFAVVGNRSPDSTDWSYFTQGLKPSDIGKLFTTGGFRRVLVGRSSVSGTRATFAEEFLGGNDGAEENAPQCPVSSGVCLEPTTMQLLTYVNDTPNSVGYAEADALPFFPNVGAIPIQVGDATKPYEPTRDNVLAGRYSFLATEYLYTNGAPAGLAAKFIGFLASPPVTAQLRATSSFIACADLVHARRGGDCPKS